MENEVTEIEKLKEQVKNLRAKNRSLKQEIDDLKEDLRRCKLKEKRRSRAGRKPLFDEDEQRAIYKEYDNGKTIKELATEHNCSAGLIHKIVNLD